MGGKICSVLLFCEGTLREPLAAYGDVFSVCPFVKKLYRLAWLGTSGITPDTEQLLSVDIQVLCQGQSLAISG